MNNCLFFTYPETSVSYTDFKGNIGDYGLMQCDFEVSLGSAIQSINISKEVLVSGPNNYSATFDLETWNNTTSQYFNGSNQININTTINNFPTNFNTRSINRLPLSDRGGFEALQILYSFQVGFQFWNQLQNFDPQFSTFHSQYEPTYTQNRVITNNGPSQVILAPGFSSIIRFKILWNVLDSATNIVTQFIKYSDYAAYDALQSIGTATITQTTEDQTSNSLNNNFAADIPTVTKTTFVTQIFDTSLATVGILSLYYQNGAATIIDTITTDMSAPNSGSLWVSVPTIVTTGGPIYTIKLDGLVDLSAANPKVSNVILYASYKHKITKNLITDSAIQITTNTPADIWID
jgi:hypothetical protein